MSFLSRFSDFKGGALSSRCLLPNPPIVSDLVSWPWAKLHRDGPVYNWPNGGIRKGAGHKRKRLCVRARSFEEYRERKQAEIETEIGEKPVKEQREEAMGVWGVGQRWELDIIGEGIDREGRVKGEVSERDRERDRQTEEKGGTRLG